MIPYLTIPGGILPSNTIYLKLNSADKNRAMKIFNEHHIKWFPLNTHVLCVPITSDEVFELCHLWEDEWIHPHNVPYPWR
jgi:hypothetical protein